VAGQTDQANREGDWKKGHPNLSPLGAEGVSEFFEEEGENEEDDRQGQKEDARVRASQYSAASGSSSGR